ncbi:hypothetical protein Hypma_007345 [Hypsizygus marmoreus]|uniref:Uncharacterized protein n=1 Tax=Hypsizygus marmoreus TaxID=39966 RepID=A0A369K1Q8_HYPMA|nr:hypothetical protein Hypma_007345 [Hypsizygus marmoreus]
MSSLSVSPAHPTFVSAHAASQGKNIFIWCTKRTYITLSWRVDENLQMTVKDMYRWLDIVIVEDETGALAPSSTRLDYALFPIVVKPNEYWVLQYTINRETGTNALDRDSRERLCPRNFGIYRRDGSKQDAYMFLPKNTFSEGHEGVVSDFPDFPGLEPTIELQDAAFAQTQSCPFTGTNSHTEDVMMKISP